MHRLVKPEKWVPVDGLILEPAAEDAVRSTENCMIIAGPGAGKTELLAQRASYLLQTGACPAPRRILAISFKKDAATNLAERVKKRCGGELARRFDSRTYDAFAKGVLDRFIRAVPQAYRPASDYEIIDGISLEVERVLESLVVPARLLPGGQWTRFQRRSIAMRFAEERLPFAGSVGNDAVRFATRAVFEDLLTQHPTRLTFRMIGRIVAYLIETNQSIRRALHATYSHVFLDEFQDTTDVQYDLLCTAFGSSQAVLTAVGDHKQRIMGWANALPAAFQSFQRDFEARQIELVMNHRSAPRLVEIQKVLAKALDPGGVDAKAAKVTSQQGECELVLFADDRQEAHFLASELESWLSDGLDPRDMCILAKRNVPTYVNNLIGTLTQRGIKARLEAEYQDLMIEPAAVTALDCMDLACRSRAPEAWARTMDLLIELNGYHPDTPHERLHELENDLRRFLADLKTELLGITPSTTTPDNIRAIFDRAFEYIGPEQYRQLLAQYRQGSRLEETLDHCAKLICKSARETGNWGDTLNHFRGVGSIPAMTIHKSKGLEYHTVIFLGLEDEAFFSFDRQRIEDTCAFFVAMSRAKQRVLLTASEHRSSGDSGAMVEQSNSKIAPLYALLEQAGVRVRDLRANP